MENGFPKVSLSYSFLILGLLMYSFATSYSVFWMRDLLHPVPEVLAPSCSAATAGCGETSCCGEKMSCCQPPQAVSFTVPHQNASSAQAEQESTLFFVTQLGCFTDSDALFAPHLKPHFPVFMGFDFLQVEPLRAWLAREPAGIWHFYSLPEKIPIS